MKKDIPAHTIQTSRLSIVNCTPVVLESLLEGNYTLSTELDIQVHPQWNIPGKRSFGLILDRISNDPRSWPWWSYLCIERTLNILIGSGGYKGPPENGIVEIGYALSPEFRNRGYATELANGLISNAWLCHDVSVIQAHTTAGENASVSVLRKCRFTLDDKLLDTREGAIWKWILQRQ